MKPHDKVVLFGSYDGFGWSTLAENSVFVMLDNGDRVEVLEYFVKDASEFVEKDKMKLKDVIARIQKLDLGTQKVWLNEILNELGSDYGTLKYKAGYEQGKLEGEWVGQQLKDADKIRQEINKPVVPQFVADWIERSKQENRNLRNALNNGGEKMCLWFLDQENYDLFGRAWLDGYEVEEEKIYTVKVKAFLDQYLGRYYVNNEELTPQFTRTQITGKEKLPTFTKKELESTGFGWVFDCPGIEIEEVE